MSDYVTINRANWDERTAAHAASRDYAFDRFISDPDYMSGVVRFDLYRHRRAVLAAGWGEMGSGRLRAATSGGPPVYP